MTSGSPANTAASGKWLELPPLHLSLTFEEPPPPAGVLFFLPAQHDRQGTRLLLFSLKENSLRKIKQKLNCARLADVGRTAVMNLPSSPLSSFCLRALCVAAAGVSMASCVGPPPPPRPGPAVVVRPGPHPLRALPPGARRVYWHGEHVWVHRGVYYRRGPEGYIVVTP